jgi:hypothetical protein
MKTRNLLASMLFVFAFFFNHTVHAQEPVAPSKIEVGVNFSSITFSGEGPLGRIILSPDDRLSEAGFGGRLTFNLNKHVALEAEGNLFPHEDYRRLRTGGRVLQGQFGVKAGKRFGKFGVFGKARPGLLTFSKVVTVVDTETIDFGGQPITIPVYDERRKMYFSMDLGGVLEFYPSRKVLTRIDVGDTIVHYGKVAPFLPFDPTPSLPSRTAHNLQVTASVGFRFMSAGPEQTTTQDPGETRHRFEVGAQFSSLGLSQVEHYMYGSLGLNFPDVRDTRTLAGFGGRLTYNLTPHFALEVQSDFYPNDNFLMNNGRAGGRMLQGQAGVKAGKRFQKFGIFAKARPGVVSFSKAAGFVLDPTFGIPIFRPERNTYFSMDVGGVLEFYPTPRIVTRFDGGDTMIRYRAFEIPILFFPTVTYQAPAETLHNFQFSAGVGYRF